MPTAVLDSSVVVALLSPTDQLHGAARGAVGGLERSGAAFVLPTLAYAEVMVGAMRGGPNRVRALDRFVDIAIDQLAPLTREVATVAARLRADDRTLRLPDAIVIATGQVLDAVLLTGHRQWARHGPRVQVVR